MFITPDNTDSLPSDFQIKIELKEISSNCYIGTSICVELVTLSGHHLQTGGSK